MQLSGGKEQLHHWKWWTLTMALQQVPREALLTALLQLKAPGWWWLAAQAQLVPGSQHPNICKTSSNRLLAPQVQLNLRATLRCGRPRGRDGLDSPDHTHCRSHSGTTAGENARCLWP